MFRNILHKIKIFFCDDDVEKIHVRDSTVIRNNEIPILLSYDIRDEIIELIEDLDNQIVVDTSVYKTNLP